MAEPGRESGSSAEASGDAADAAVEGPAAEPLELTILMPCLDEAETVGPCVARARRFLERRGLRGEVLVVDNGSRDGSPEIARRAGARVVAARERGYGAALRAGLEAARGRYVVMGDADASYDFGALDPFLERLRSGAELVIGNRLRGAIRPGAMPALHRWVGNPLLSALGRLFFRVPVGDFHCGLRAVRRDVVPRLALASRGMEFASEMVAKAGAAGVRIEEVPIVLHPDGRSRAPHLRTWRDGWRHLRWMLLFSPRWLFLLPGVVLLGGGALAFAWLAGAPRTVAGVTFGVHSLLVAGLACLIGQQLLVFAVFTRVLAAARGPRGLPPALERLRRRLSVELGVGVGALLGLAGLAFLLGAIWQWGAAAFGDLEPERTMRLVIPGAVLLALGVQTVFSSFFLGVLDVDREERGGAEPPV